MVNFIFKFILFIMYLFKLKNQIALYSHKEGHEVRGELYLGSETK